MKKYSFILVALLFFITANKAFAVTPSSGVDWYSFSAEKDMTQARYYNGGVYVISYDSGHTCSGADISDAGRAESSYYQGTAPLGSTFLDLKNASRITQPSEPMTDPKTDGYYCLLVNDSNSGDWIADNSVPFHYIYNAPAGPSGVAGLIDTASSTFHTDLGFGLGDVTTLMKSQMLLVMGSGLGTIKAMLPFIISLVIITSIAFFFFRAFRFFRD